VASRVPTVAVAGDGLKSRVREGAADKAAIQRVKVPPCQLPVSDT